MSYCYDFIRKFKKEGNFCGLDKSEVSRLENYIEIIEMLMKQHRDLDERKIIENFPLGAARHLLPIKDERRAEGLDFVAHQLTEGKHISGKDLCKKLEISNNKPHGTPESTNGTQSLKTPPSPGPEVRAAEMAAASVNQPKTSPFHTAAELKEKQAGGIAGEMFPKDPTIKQPLTVPPAPVVKTEKMLFMEACEQAYEHGNTEFKLAITNLLEYHPSWKTPGSAIFFCVTNPKEAIVGRK